MKKILKDRYLWGIVALSLVLIMYTWLHVSSKVNWLPSDTTMPITDAVIELIMVLSIVILAAYRFRTRGGLIAGLTGFIVVTLGHLDALVKTDVLVKSLLIGVSIISTSYIVSNFADAKKKSKQAEEKIRSIVENSSDQIFMLDRNCKFLSINKTAADISNKSPQEMIGMSIFKIFPEDSAVRFSNNVKNVFDIGKSMLIEEKMLAQGREFYNSTSLNPVKDDKGSVIAITGIVRDITERKKTEELLIESESRLKLAIEALVSGVWELNVKTGKAWRSLRHDQIFGYTTLLPEWTYQMFLDHVIPEDRSEVDSKYGYALSTNTEWNFECRIRRVDNTVRWIAAQGKPSEYDDKNEVVMLSGIVRDITERKQAEIDLRDSESKFKAIFNNVTDGMLGVDVDTKKCVMANKAICTMLGYSQEEIQNLGVPDIHPEKDLPFVMQGFERQLRGEIDISSEIPIKRKDGSIFYADVNATKILLANKTYLVGNFRDITERKQAEELIQASLKEKETLLKEVHHRVKNNMQVIKSLLHLQEENIQDKDALALLKDSQQQIQAMALVYNKLYLSSNLASINMADYIKELTVGLIKSCTTAPHRVAANIAPSDVSLGIDVAIPCGLIINELITNSLKYAFPENKVGQIAVSLKGDGNHGLALTVSDDGVGIPESITLSNNGTLGLKLVTSLVQDQLEGKIELDRTQGTTFKITFPRGKEKK